jgi:ornithine cyclodeaminase
MNIPFFDGLTLAATLRYTDLVEHLRQAHRKPPPEVQRLLMQQPVAGGADNGFLIWPAWQHGSQLGVKLCTLFPQNRDRPTVQALYALFDGTNGSLQVLMDGTELTYWKTAADSALGADLLARADAATLLVVGAGAMAAHMVRAYRAVRPGLSRVLVWNRTPGRAVALLAQLDGIAELAPDLAQAVQAADIVCCVTSSASPLVAGDWLRPGTHLDLIGGYTPQMREADDAAVRRARIFVDSRWFTVEHVGDLTQPIASGVIRREDVRGDLFELCSGRVAGREKTSDITLFKSGGGAHLDLMTAQHLAAQLL